MIFKTHVRNFCVRHFLTLNDVNVWQCRQLCTSQEVPVCPNICNRQVLISCFCFFLQFTFLCITIFVPWNQHALNKPSPNNDSWQLQQIFIYLFIYLFIFYLFIYFFFALGSSYWSSFGDTFIIMSLNTCFPVLNTEEIRAHVKLLCYALWAPIEINVQVLYISNFRNIYLIISFFLCTNTKLLVQNLLWFFTHIACCKSHTTFITYTEV